jgi:methionine sulfoxide reductase catalytic subunit
MEEIRQLGAASQITLHHCIQGWSGIAQWGGLRMVDLMKLVKPTAEARAVIFYSFGEGGQAAEGGGQYYDSHTMENMRHPQALLAYEMNGRPLNDVHGAPLRLRSETQLGFKMVKWITSIEFAADVKHVYKGEGGYAQDNEFFDSMADI